MKVQKLFLNEIKTSLTKLDSNGESLKYPNFCKYYIRCAMGIHERKYFEDICTRTKEYLDEDFDKKAQKNFHQRSWEMYMVNLMLNNSKSLVVPDKQGDADIKFEVMNNKTLHVECVAPKKGEDGNIKSVADREIYDGKFTIYDSEPHKFIIRLCNSLLEKFEQYQRRLLSGKVLITDQYVIAINMDIVTADYIKMSDVLSYFSFYGYEIEKISYDQVSTKVYENTTWSREIIQSPIVINGEKKDIHIPLVFLNTKIGLGISGVILSFHKVINNVIEERILHFIHNPDAQNPVDRSEFAFMNQYFLSKKMVKYK